MMGFIEKTLLKDEKIVYKGHRHWVVFIFPLLFLSVGLVFVIKGLELPMEDIVPLQLGHIIDIYTAYKIVKIVIFIPLLFALITISNAMIDYFMSEIAVTNLRILIKIGFIKRISTEIPLRNIATIKVGQSVWGRILHYGTVEICDVGNVCLPFKRISSPIVFRYHVQTEINKRTFKKPVQPVEIIEK